MPCGESALWCPAASNYTLRGYSAVQNLTSEKKRNMRNLDVATGYRTFLLT